MKSRVWKINENGYVLGTENKKSRRFTRLLFGIYDKRCIDHINGDRKDNRRSNLWIGSNTMNHGNQSLNSRNSTGYKGVSTRRKTNKFRAYINKNGFRKELGYFNTPEEAAKAYDEAARFYLENLPM